MHLQVNFINHELKWDFYFLHLFEDSQDQQTKHVLLARFWKIVAYISFRKYPTKLQACEDITVIGFKSLLHVRTWTPLERRDNRRPEKIKLFQDNDNLQCIGGGDSNVCIGSLIFVCQIFVSMFHFMPNSSGHLPRFAHSSWARKTSWSSV